MNIEDLKNSDFVVNRDHLFNVRKNIEYNKQVIKFYKKLLFNSRFISNPRYRQKAKEYENYDPDSIHWDSNTSTSNYIEKVLTIENKIANLMNCNSLFLTDVYNVQNVEVMIKTNLCKDRFCNNCKKVKQASRMQRFIPEMKKYSEYDLYHLTLTVPNVEGKNLRNTTDIMARSFARFVEYLKGKEKIAGIDFKKFGYKGAIRSLEVTSNNKTGYHPHYHVALCLDYKDGEKHIVNKFSKKHGVVKKKFSDAEVLFQKLWKLLILQESVSVPNKKKIKEIEANPRMTLREKNKKISALEKEMKEHVRKNPVSKKAIDNLELGYSVNMDLFEEDHYFELFKYMTKAKDDEDAAVNYETFLHLYFQLKGVRQIQGYGCFFRLKDDDMSEEVDIIFTTFESLLQAVETPEVRSVKPEVLYLESERTLLSKNTLYNTIREIEDKEKATDQIFEALNVDELKEKVRQKDLGSICLTAAEKENVHSRNDLGSFPNNVDVLGDS